MQLIGNNFDVQPTALANGRVGWQWSVNSKTDFVQFGTCHDKRSAVLAARNFIKRNQALVFGEG